MLRLGSETLLITPRWGKLRQQNYGCGYQNNYSVVLEIVTSILGSLITNFADEYLKKDCLFLSING